MTKKTLLKSLWDDDMVARYPPSDDGSSTVDCDSILLLISLEQPS